MKRCLRGAAAGLGALALVAIAGPAQAAWIKAETDKFIVYGQGSEKAVRDYAAKLTTFDMLLRIYNPSVKDRKPPTKVQVFMLGNAQGLKRVRPNVGRYVLGFYAAMNEGVFAFAVNSEQFGSDDVLFHEYAHHFMLENFPTAYPAWFVEGWAEYFMTAEIKGNQLKVGGYNPARAYGILEEAWLPLDQVLSKSVADTKSARVNTYYAQAWLLMHYMFSDPKRAAQINKATLAITQGESPVKALEAATGMTMDQLTKELKAYRRLPVTTLTLKEPPPAASIAVARLPASADDLLLDNARLILAPTGTVDAGLVADVRRKAARYPGDALAERTLARLEFVMGDVAAGEAIMKRRLETSPDDLEDLLLAGTGQIMAGMRDKASRDTRYRAARPMLAKAYQLNKTDFRPLYAYALSRSIEPTFPTDNDLTALLEARYLAPAVQENSIRAGLALLKKGRRDEAARMLAVVINNPHGGAFAARAREALGQGMIGAIDLESMTEDEEEGKPPAEPAKPAG
ncbi:hypothetical protein [Phenylobacterium sp.]|uniref:hypothetical protein n=1 Tax=Phenylobacterium sp. TaxID=1871053 RepID=UPI002EDA632E